MNFRIPSKLSYQFKYCSNEESWQNHQSCEEKCVRFRKKTYIYYYFLISMCNKNPIQPAVFYAPKVLENAAHMTLLQQQLDASGKHWNLSALGMRIVAGADLLGRVSNRFFQKLNRQQRKLILWSIWSEWEIPALCPVTSDTIYKYEFHLLTNELQRKNPSQSKILEWFLLNISLLMISKNKSEEYTKRTNKSKPTLRMRFLQINDKIFCIPVSPNHIEAQSLFVCLWKKKRFEVVIENHIG